VVPTVQQPPLVIGMCISCYFRVVKKVLKKRAKKKINWMTKEHAKVKIEELNFSRYWF
jgi:hypothetical protein